MKVTFVHHSCFVVDLDAKTLVFDYFGGDKVNGYHFHGRLPEFETDKPLYFFASHRHQDHFDLDILKLAEKYPKIHYVLSKDIRLGANYLLRHGIPLSVKKKITFVSPNGEYTLPSEQAREEDMIKLLTLRSTDEGVAFYIETEGRHIYHAGDLHNWCFEGAGGLVNGKMESGYRMALKHLANKHIDAAFVVLDPRLGEHTYKGLDYFMQNIHADYIFPMHMWQQYGLVEEYKKMCFNDRYMERLVDIRNENETFDLWS